MPDRPFESCPCSFCPKCKSIMRDGECPACGWSEDTPDFYDDTEAIHRGV